MARAHGETVLWSLFAAGGVVTALFIPVIIFITGVGMPFQSTNFPVVWTLVNSVLGRLVLTVAIPLPLFHCAHRIVHTSKDLGLRAMHGLIAVLFYGGAVVGTGAAVWIIWFMQLPKTN